MDAHHQEIHRRREQAEADYAHALKDLQTAQQRYNEPVGWFAKACANVRALTTKIESNRAEVQRAHEQFQQRFADAGFVVDKAARQALTQKSEAETVQSELERAIGIHDRQRQESLLPASTAGRDLVKAHSHALGAWSNLMMLRALDDHGLPFVRAVARAQSGIAYFPEDQRFKPDTTPSEEALKSLYRELQRWASSLNEHRAPQRCAEDDPAVPADADLGPLGIRDLMSSVRVNAAKRALAAQDKNEQPASLGEQAMHLEILGHLSRTT